MIWTGRWWIPCGCGKRSIFCSFPKKGWRSRRISRLFRISWKAWDLQRLPPSFKERFLLADPIEEIKETWIRMAEDKYCNQVPLKPGAGELLEKLKERNLQIGISFQQQPGTDPKSPEGSSYRSVFWMYHYLLPGTFRETGPGRLSGDGQRTEGFSGGLSGV